MTNIVNQIINLNSINSIKQNSSYNSSVFFQFPSLLVQKKIIKNVTVSVLNAQIPYSYYNVNVYNNVFRISNGGGIVTITLTRGNYNSNSLITEIIGQLTLAGITGISIVLSSVTGCYTWTTSAASMTIYSSGSTALKFLGLDTTVNTTSVSQKIVSPYPLNLLYTLKIRIASTALSTNHLDSSVGGTLNILASFPVNAANFGIVLYENQTNIQSHLNLRDLNGFDIQILDDDSNLINFNSVEWTATMMLQVEYEDETIAPVFNPMEYGLPTQQFWGVNPNNNLDNNISNVDPSTDVIDNTSTDVNSPAQTEPTVPLDTGNTTQEVPQGTNPQESTDNQTQQLTTDTTASNEMTYPNEMTAPEIPDNGDLGILLWNNKLTI